MGRGSLCLNDSPSDSSSHRFGCYSIGTCSPPGPLATNQVRASSHDEMERALRLAGGRNERHFEPRHAPYHPRPYRDQPMVRMGPIARNGFLILTRVPINLQWLPGLDTGAILPQMHQAQPAMMMYQQMGGVNPYQNMAASQPGYSFNPYLANIQQQQQQQQPAYATFPQGQQQQPAYAQQQPVCMEKI